MLFLVGWIILGVLAVILFFYFRQPAEDDPEADEEAEWEDIMEDLDHYD